MAGLPIGFAPLPVAGVSVHTSGPAWLPPTGQPLAPYPPPPFRPIPADRAAVPPESDGSLAIVPLIPNKRYYGETPVGPARATGAASEGIPGGLIIVIWQRHHHSFSASLWQPSTSGADDSVGLDRAQSLLEGQIRLAGSEGVRSPWGMGILR